ncbi:hypothetical protein ACQPZJ_37930 [Actinoplanes sp. CA-054009]
MARQNRTRWLRGDDTLIELMHAVDAPNELWTEPSRPGVLLALDELIAWFDDTRVFDDRTHVSGWESAGRDFFDALDRLGQRVRASLDPQMTSLRSLWRNDIGRDQVMRDRFRSNALVLRSTLAIADITIAAWRDLQKTCAQVTRSTSTVAARRDSFWEIIRASDRNADELSKLLTGVLSGSRLGALNALIALGDVDPTSVDVRGLRSAPDLSVTERMQLAERVLVRPVTSHAHVVWLAFRQAEMTSMGKSLPAVEFFNAQWLHGNLFQDGPFRDQLPAELTQIDEPALLPDEKNVVLVRLDLGIGKFPNAIREATQRVNALLGMSLFGCALPWEQLPGVIHVQDGRIVHHRVFVDFDRGEYPHALDSTAAQLTRMAPRVAPKIPVADPAARDIVEALQWWRTGVTPSLTESLLLNVRVIELVASRLGESSWTTYLEKNLKNLWIRESIADVLFRAFHEALHQPVPAEMQARQRAVLLETTSFPGGEQQFSIAGAASHLAEMLDFTSSRTPLGRDLRTIRQSSASGAGLQDWARELESQWAPSIHRLERVRNSVAHGGPFTDRAVQLVHPLSQQLSVWSLWECIEAVVEGHKLPDAFRDTRKRWDAWRTSLANATSVADIFAAP